MKENVEIVLFSIFLSGFWLKSDTFVEQPNVHFKHQYLFLGDVQGTDGPIHCSTYPILDEQFVDQKNRCPIVKVLTCTFCVKLASKK
jgi:hypothetical protein